MALKSFFSRIRSSFKLCRSKNPSIPENPINLSPNPLFVDCQPATPLPFKKPRRSFKRVSSFLGCGFRIHEDDLPESPPCKWDETPRRDYNSSISSDSDDELFSLPPTPTRHPITSSISGELFTPPPPPPPTPTPHSITTSSPCKLDETPRRNYNSSISSYSDDELFSLPPTPTRHPITSSISGELFTPPPPPPPPPPTPTRHSITTSLADSGLCGYESDDEEEEEMVTLSLNRKRRMKKLQPSFPAERSKMEGGRSLLERCDKLVAEMNVETPRKAAESMEQRRRRRQRVSPVHSPKRIGSDQTNTNRSPRNRKPTAEIDPKKKIAIAIEDESTSISESSARTSSQTDTERSKMEGGRRSLLERCDKLLHSIAEMRSGTKLQPSTVSVLDSSFYKDESSSPSPVMKRSIDFKDELGEFDEDIWSPAISPIQSKCEDKSDDCDFVYISEILRASNYLPEDYDIFQWLERQQNDTSEVSNLQRKLIYDTVSEILDKEREMPPWKVLSLSNSSIEKPSLHQIWSEFQRIRERDTAEDLLDIVCEMPRKDLVGDEIIGWGDCPVEMSEATLDIERMIFKDLVSETIGDLVASAENRKSSTRCGKLVL